jgi:hypothetical protein
LRKDTLALNEVSPSSEFRTSPETSQDVTDDGVPQELAALVTQSNWQEIKANVKNGKPVPRTQYCGVSRRGKKYTARIRFGRGGKQVHLGVFRTAIEAACARYLAKMEHAMQCQSGCHCDDKVWVDKMGRITGVANYR